MMKQVSIFLLFILIFALLFVLLQFIYSQYAPNTPLLDLLVIVITVLIFLPISFLSAKKLVNKFDR